VQLRLKFEATRVVEGERERETETEVLGLRGLAEAAAQVLSLLALLV
jgi:hypothetical protein